MGWRHSSDCWGWLWAELGWKKSNEFPLSKRALESTTKKKNCVNDPALEQDANSNQGKKIEQLGNGIWKLGFKNYLFCKLIHLGIALPFLFPLFLFSRGGRDVSRCREKQRLSGQQQGSEVTVIYWNEMGVVDLSACTGASCPEASWFNHGKSTSVALQKTGNNKTRTNCTNSKTHSKMEMGNFNKAMNASAKKTTRRGKVV